MIAQANVGPQNNIPDTTLNNPLRQDRQGGLVVSELHGRFFEQTYRGNVFAAPLTLTAINAATFTSATTGATATPILGIYNPLNSGVNLSILQAKLSAILTALTATGGAPFVWMGSAGNNAVSTGTAPLNAKTLASTSGGVNGTGSQAKNVSGLALTGLTNVLALLEGSSLSGGVPMNVSQIYTVAGIPWHVASIENIDGSLIVPPGGVLALMATTTPVAHSAVGSLVYEEVPI